MLAMALIGYEQQKSKIEEKIREIKGHLANSRKSAGTASDEPANAGNVAVKGKRTLSAEARKRIAAAQKRRWAEHRKSLAQAE